MEIELLGGFKFFFILVVSFKFFFILVVSSKFFYFCNNRSYTRIGILNIRTCFTLKRKRFCWIEHKSFRWICFDHKEVDRSECYLFGPFMGGTFIEVRISPCDFFNTFLVKFFDKIVCVDNISCTRFHLSVRQFNHSI